MIAIKKYGNRRLYDTEESRYITLEELAAKVQRGAEVQVLDAKSGADLTQPTLVQIIIESRGAARMLPVPLLVQLIRLGDESLAEFLGRYVAGALELYLQARTGLQQISGFNPFGGSSFGPGQLFNRMMGGGFGGPGSYGGGAPAASAPPAAASPGPGLDEVQALRREMDALKH
jgi:polyhydroxyalkanoate synthesis repressor PhaR